jgi:two-component system chemotaxis response regulator CheB
MSHPIRVYLIDSTGASRLTGHILPIEELRIVGISQSAQQAVAEIPKKKPSVILLSINTPEEGFSWISELRRSSVRNKIITIGEAVDKLQLLSFGAAAHMSKPAQDPNALSKFASELKERLLSLLSAERPSNSRPRAIVVGSSTGGPDALATFISGLPGDFPLPIMIVQHMLPNFTKSLVERLSSRSKIPVSVSKPGALLAPNQIWVAEGGIHMAIDENNGVRLIHSKEPPENSCRPAVDVLFRSAARVLGGACLGLMFTGMGRDGLKGSQDIHRAGGEIWAQDEATSIVWGMPGVVAQAGLAKRVLPIQDFAPQCIQFLTENKFFFKGALP